MDGFNQSFTAFCRKQAPEGVGVNVAAFSFDAQYRGNTPWHYSMAQGDCISQNMYYHTMQTALSRPPGLGLVDTSQVADRLFVMTEAGCGRPNPYHVEFPFRLAAFASWQDWDGVFFHYFQEPLWYWKTINPDEQYLLCALPYKFNTADVLVECDPALCSAAGLAGQIFRNLSLASAKNPVIYEAGARAIFGYDKWGGVGYARDAFTKGARLRYRPGAETMVTVDGKEPPQHEAVTEAVASGEQVLWDWPNTRLVADSPHAKIYVGRPEKQHRFADGIVLEGLTSEFVIFGMVSDDGLPLIESRRIKIWAGWNNLNTGYEIAPAMLRKQGFAHPGDKHKAVIEKGHPPILADVVPYTLRFPRRLDYRFEGYDFALRKCYEKAGRDTNVLEHDGRYLFMGVLHVLRHGEPVAQRAAPGAKPTVPPKAAGGAAPAGGAAQGGLYHPVAGLSWSDDLAVAKKKVTGWSATDVDASRGEATLVTRAKVLGATADVEIAFRRPGGAEGAAAATAEYAMRRVSVSFTQGPALTDVVAGYEKRFGKPASKTLATYAYQTSRIVWRPAGLTVTVTDHQGNMVIDLSRP